MSSRIPKFFQLEKYNISPGDVVQTVLHCEASRIQARVVVMPHWRVEIFAGVASESTEIVPDSLYQLEYRGQPVTVIRSGIGAAQTGEVLLALGCTPCETILFTGSVGGLGHTVRIGDLIVVDRSFCGDGFSRYLDDNILPRDCFLQAVEPDCELTEKIYKHTAEACLAMPVPFHRGAIFSTDSILAQFFRLDYFRNEVDCIGIEMETAAVFRAAGLVGIRAGALLQVSDLPQRNKSIYAGRTKAEMQQRKLIRQEVLARVVLQSVTSA